MKRRLSVAISTIGDPKVCVILDLFEEVKRAVSIFLTILFFCPLFPCTQCVPG
jgi:hypothetical protein